MCLENQSDPKKTFKQESGAVFVDMQRSSKPDKLSDILHEAEIKFGVPNGLLFEIIREERLRLYQLKKKPLKEEIAAVFGKYGASE